MQTLACRSLFKARLFIGSCSAFNITTTVLIASGLITRGKNLLLRLVLLDLLRIPATHSSFAILLRAQMTLLGHKEIVFDRYCLRFKLLV